MWRFRIAGGLRLLSALSLLGLAVLVFIGPSSEWFGPRVELGLAQAPKLLPGAQTGSRAGARGFIVTARPNPAGTRLWWDGQERGSTPVVANVRCREGADVELGLRAEGYAPWAKTVACREGGSLLIKPRLDKAR